MLSRALAPLRRLAPVAACTAAHSSAVLPAAAAAQGGQSWGWAAAAAASAGLACCFDAAAADDSRDDMLIFTGNANPALAKEIATALKKKLAPADVKSFADGEVSIRLKENVRGRQVYIVQPTCPDVNKNLMELLLLISTARRASADKITAVIPYYGYARQDRKLSSRVPISAADVAVLLESMGVDRVVAVDLHCGQIQGFFSPRTPVDNLDGGIVGVKYFADKGLNNVTVVSPDAGGVYRCKRFRERLAVETNGALDAGLAMIVKQRAAANQISRMDLVGDVAGSDVIIVDDMIDTAGTLCKAAEELKKRGANRVFALASHGLFSKAASVRIEQSVLEEVVVLNTVPPNEQVKGNSKIKYISVASLLADAIECIHDRKSISELFKSRAAAAAAGEE